MRRDEKLSKDQAQLMGQTAVRVRWTKEKVIDGREDCSDGEMFLVDSDSSRCTRTFLSHKSPNSHAAKASSIPYIS